MATYNGEDVVESDAEPEDASGTQHSSQEATKSQGTRTTGYRSTEISGGSGQKSKDKNRISPSTTEPVKEEVKNKSRKRVPENEYKEYLEIIKSVIPDDIDILIISHDDDIAEVRKFKENIEKNVRFTIYGKSMVPLVEILKDIAGFAPTIVDHAYGRALFIFVFVTKNFCNKDFSLLQSHACLEKSLDDKNKQKFVIPVHTSPKGIDPKTDGSYTFPLVQNGVQSLYYDDVEIFEKVRMLLECEKNTIANKLIDKEEQWEMYYAKNRQRLEKQKARFGSKSAEFSKQETSFACQAPKSNVTAGEIRLLGHAVEVMKMTQDTDTEHRQLAQSQSNSVSHNSSDAKQSSFDKEQLFMPDASYSSQDSPLNSLSTQRSTYMSQAAQSHGVPPQPVSNRHIPTSYPQYNQPVEGAPAITVQQPQSHIPYPVAQGSFEGNYFGTGQTVGAADPHSSAKSDRTPSAGPSSAATSVIQHIHHHHHKKNITVAKATNVLIGDKSQILNKNLVRVISDNESGDDDGDEDYAEASASRSGAAHFTKFRENSSWSHENSPAPNDHVQSGNEDSRNVSMGFTEFLIPASCRQPVERSEIEYSASYDGKEQTFCKQLM